MLNNCLKSIWKSLRANAWLIWILSRRQYAARYKGSLLGPFLPLAYTLGMLAVYSFVFSVVIQMKWAQAGITEVTDEYPFWLILFSGQILYQFAAEALTLGPGLVISVPNYVKKVIFPLPLLPCVNLIVSLFTLGINLLLLLAAAAVLGQIHPTVLFLPFILLEACIWVLGVGWLLGALGVFIRDLQHFMAVIAQILLFATPVFYPISFVPNKFIFILKMNPLTHMVEGLRSIALWGHMPDMGTQYLWMIAACVFAAAGYCFFQRMRPTFADVM